MKITVENAQTLLQKAASLRDEEERIPLEQAVDRISCRQVTARWDMPPFDRSPLDGYALCSNDITMASPETPIELPVKTDIFAGDRRHWCITPGEVARIMTGAVLPQGADCVIKQEFVTLRKRKAVFTKPEKPFNNICFRGEDLCRGEVILQQGERITPAHVGILAAQGYSEVAVYCHPRVMLISTGNELLPPGKELPYGTIFDSNRSYILARLQQLGAVTDSFKVKDDMEAILQLLQCNISQYDFFITTGGVSVGEKDLLPKALELLEAKILFRGVDMQPGGAVTAGIMQEKLILCLPGSPFAAVATFELYAVPALLRQAGISAPLPRRSRLVLSTPYKKARHRRRFLRAHAENGLVSLPQQHESGNIFSLLGCNCLVDAAAGEEWLAVGDTVEVVLFER